MYCSYLKITVISDTRFKKMVDPADLVTDLILILGFLSDFSGYRPARGSCFCKTYNNPQWGSLSEKSICKCKGLLFFFSRC